MACLQGRLDAECIFSCTAKSTSCPCSPVKDDNSVLLPGPAAASYGVYCAKLSGIPAQVLNRAKQLLLLQQQGRHIQRAESSQQKTQDASNLAVVKGLAELHAYDRPLVERFFRDLIKD